MFTYWSVEMKTSIQQGKKVFNHKGNALSGILTKNKAKNSRLTEHNQPIKLNYRETEEVKRYIRTNVLRYTSKQICKQMSIIRLKCAFWISYALKLTGFFFTVTFYVFFFSINLLLQILIFLFHWGKCNRVFLIYKKKSYSKFDKNDEH